MPVWEYKVVPAPTKGQKAKGLKTAEARFAHAIEQFMNDLATEGWEFQRAETLPSTERSGLTGSTTEWRNLLVFRRAAKTVEDAFTPELLPAPAGAEATEHDAAPPTNTGNSDAAQDTETASDTKPQNVRISDS